MNLFNYASRTLKRVLGGAGHLLSSHAHGEREIVIASFNNSGSQLLHSMLTNVNERIAEAGNQETDAQSEKVRLICTNETLQPNQKQSIVVYRDAADALCCYYGESVAGIAVAETDAAAETVDKYCLAHFVDWQTHLETCLDIVADNEHDLIAVSYERLQQHAIETLWSTCGAIGLQPTLEMCRYAVEDHASELQPKYGISRNALEIKTYNTIQNLAQPLYRRAMMTGVKSEAA